jgi:hypothetical protein
MKFIYFIFFNCCSLWVSAQNLNLTKDSIYNKQEPSDRSKIGKLMWGNGERQEFYTGDTLYTTSGFKFYYGQTLKIGSGSGEKGYFKNIIEVDRNNTDLSYTSTDVGGIDGKILKGTASSGFNVQVKNSDFDITSVMQPKSANKTFVVVNLKRDGNKKTGYTYFPVIAEPVDAGLFESKRLTGNLGTARYIVQYESAVNTGELIYPGKTGKNSNAQTVEVKITQEKPTSSLADELKKLKELLDSGVLSKQEFEEAKKKLLSKY